MTPQFSFLIISSLIVQSISLEELFQQVKKHEAGIVENIMANVMMTMAKRIFQNVMEVTRIVQTRAILNDKWIMAKMFLVYHLMET
jgi:hypothetical protein